ncbi:hypothetical protein C7Y58_09995 [Fusobacterium nucleatum subsp. nucleatum ATCC 25586]|uniref:Hypothetical cytosolic protein n=1 Tax=Fusobacterium nucleatum subsp. nucleatum (strain ATCC 25586 / DSM 15643 / BCRC 10681 / CIP 101130 / JCM 8532 / KCTC 2640 / LMG 13131 / VPI 4355) TaxID=190304 RepID=Q8RDV1_FUSNN|nr:hypothetical protein [Fusobacterium nucleatum]AAL95592.1 Hypothetical cytosolic protein [Fusobacterium nucleatum subsp. nucleatum ATCC 25586]AVQ15697.1 hypothetical protein C7Y58_09995 [Fusobacterium nucleatum subsp. nucleatum ATCC 25586]WMS28731.1 hypothetical protein RDV57_06200 [Fusobacterium nucleatum]
MENMYILKSKNSIIFNDGDINEVVFNFKEYEDILNNLSTEKYNFFKMIHEKYNIKNEEEIKNKFLYIFHFILIKNICNYILDKYTSKKINFLYFNKNIKNEKFKLSDELSLDDVLRNIIISLINSEEYLSQNLNIDFKKFDINEIISDKIKDKGINFYFYYDSMKKQDLKSKIEKDLLELGYIDKNKKNTDNRYTLSIYIDDEQLEKIGIDNYQDYLLNWISIGYLKMLIKIHDFLINYYNLTLEKGLKIDDVMLVLIDIFDTEVKEFPQGLKKSIEVGKETSGKCFFINKIIQPVSLTPELTLLLQGKDAYNVVPRI